MAQFKVNWHLDRGHASHREGDVIELDEPEAKHLQTFGVISPHPHPNPFGPSSDTGGLGHGPDDDDDLDDGEVIAPEELARLPKAELAKYAKDKYGEDLQGMTKDAMLARIAELAAVQGGV